MTTCLGATTASLLLLFFYFNWLLIKHVNSGIRLHNIYIVVKLINHSSIHSCCVLVRRFVKQHDIHNPPQVHRSSARRDRELSIVATKASIANNKVTDSIFWPTFFLRWLCRACPTRKLLLPQQFFRHAYVYALEHCVVLLVNTKEHVIGDVKLGRERQKNPDMHYFCWVPF